MKGVIWGKDGGEFWDSCVALESDEAVSLTSPEEKLATVHQWMADNLILLRDTLQPHLDQLMRVEDAASDAVEGAD